VYQRFRPNLDKRCEMIITGSLVNILEVSFLFGTAGARTKYIEPKIKHPNQVNLVIA
jgi:hypothetical protein